MAVIKFDRATCLGAQLMKYFSLHRGQSDVWAGFQSALQHQNGQHHNAVQ